jgi:hypothetical protein
MGSQDAVMAKETALQNKAFAIDRVLMWQPEFHNPFETTQQIGLCIQFICNGPSTTSTADCDCG